MPTSHSVIINKTARYFTLGTLSDKIETVWFVLHGYGQLAKDFIDEFSILENNTTYIIAPEAINKFYLRGFTGKIGATWLTKEDRENEIKDYNNFLENVFIKELDKDYNKKFKINILGFSQGAHTTVRWLNKYKHKIDNLILWGGSFPKDRNLNETYWSSFQVKIIIGDNDRFLNKEVIEEEKKYLKSHNINYTFFNFKGKHKINKDVLHTLSI
jgi:predicted esterase